MAAKAIDYYTSFYKDGLDPKAAVGWEEPDAQTAFINEQIAAKWAEAEIKKRMAPKIEEALGTWQAIYLWEHRERPHRRRPAPP